MDVILDIDTTVSTDQHQELDIPSLKDGDEHGEVHTQSSAHRASCRKKGLCLPLHKFTPSHCINKLR